MFDKFGPEADNIVHITKENGIAKPSIITYAEGRELEEW